MSKGLDALENLYMAGDLELNYVIGGKQKEDYEIVEKELKALEIIKSKFMFTRGELKYLLSGKAITQEEYNLLNEVFK
ncbi:MAG: hypothetical protein J6T10_07745 [Methanobrevibacter sp.]|nr:hypothetical protein [Methanobrevibacter sp.]